MMDNYFDALDDAAETSSAASTVVKGPENFFEETLSEAPARPGANETIAPKTTPGRTWKDDLTDGMSLDTAREKSRVLTRSWKENPRPETPQEASERASFKGALTQAATSLQVEALANTADYLADATGYDSFTGLAKSLRESINKDGSDYKAVYESYRDVNGMADVWGYLKERSGQAVGAMVPSLVGGTAGGLIGGIEGGTYGKAGAAIGGIGGATVGALLGNVHLQISDMREALIQNGVKDKEQLTKYTTYGAAALLMLDTAFPAYTLAKFGGGAKRWLSGKVAEKMVETQAKGLAMPTVASFVRSIGWEMSKGLTLEVTTELMQQAITDLKAKQWAGKDVTEADMRKFALETAPEVILSTAIGAGFMSLPGATLHGAANVRDARKAVLDERAAAAGTSEETEPAVGGAQPEMRDGKPAPADLAAAAAAAPEQVNPSIDQTAPSQATGKKAVTALQFIRDNGGIQPSGELDAVDAHRYPGLMNQGGLSADEMRERLVEGGYLEESGPDAPAITTPDDVFDIVRRSVSGERIVPVGDQMADDAFFAQRDSRDAQRELVHSEKTIVLPEIEQIDEELGQPIFMKLFRALSSDDRMEAIDRIRRGEHADNVIEQITIKNVDVEGIQAMAMARGPDPEMVDRFRSMLAQQAPDMLEKFDEILSTFPVRRMRAAKPEVALAPPMEIAASPETYAAYDGALDADSPAQFTQALQRIDTPSLKAMAKKLGTKVGRTRATLLSDISSRYLQDVRGAKTTDAFGEIRSRFKSALLRRSEDIAAAQPAGNDVLDGGQGADRLRDLPELPAVPVGRSVAPTYLVSLIDGSKISDLSKYLNKINVDPDHYQRTYHLGDDYPTLTPNAVAERYESSGARERETYESFEKQFTFGGLKQKAEEARQKALEAMPESERVAAEEVAPPPRDLTAELRALIATKVPSTKWASSLGVSPEALRPAIESLSGEGGIIRRDRRGVAHPDMPSGSLTVEQATADLQAHYQGLDSIETEEFKGGLEGKQTLRRPKQDAVKAWMTKGEALADRLRLMSKPDAVATAEAFMGMKLGGASRLSRAKVAEWAANRFRWIGDSTLKNAMQSGRSAALAFPGRIAGEENVTLTNDALDKAEKLEQVARSAVAGILPESTAIEVQQSIDLARIAREDQLFALSSGTPDILPATRGASNGRLVESRPAAGREGGEAGARGTPARGAARPGESNETAGDRGDAGLAGNGVQRIVRQESATLRADGGIYVGRAAKKKGSRASRDSLDPQRIGETLGFAFPDPDYTGRVEAEPLEGIDRREGNLSRLVYRVYPKGVRITEDTAADAEMHVVQHSDGAWEIEAINVETPRMGLGTKLYNAVEKDLGIRMSPSGVLSDEGLAFWKKRSPESVKWHQKTDTWAGFNFSPRRTKSELDRVGRELVRVTQGQGTAARIPEFERDKLVVKLRSERGKLITMWAKTPAEARAAVNTMFSLAGVNAKTVNQESLERAQALAKQRGQTSESVWKETGWYKGFDGKWRFEINDKMAGLNPKVAAELEELGVKNAASWSGRGYSWRGTLGEALDHPQLFRAYPQLAAISLTLGSLDSWTTAGSFDRDKNAIKAAGYDEGTIMDTLVHEVQHAIQSIEDFTRGGNPTMQAAANEKTLFEIEKQLEAAQAKGIGHNSIPHLEAVRAAIVDTNERLSNIASSLAYSEPQKAVYRAIAGEVEARNVSRRRRMSPAEGRAASPLSTEDVTRENQVSPGEPASVAYENETRIISAMDQAWRSVDAETPLYRKSEDNYGGLPESDPAHRMGFDAIVTNPRGRDSNMSNFWYFDRRSMIAQALENGILPEAEAIEQRIQMEGSRSLELIEALQNLPEDQQWRRPRIIDELRGKAAHIDELNKVARIFHRAIEIGGADIGEKPGFITRGLDRGGAVESFGGEIATRDEVEEAKEKLSEKIQGMYAEDVNDRSVSDTYGYFEDFDTHGWHILEQGTARLKPEIGTTDVYGAAKEVERRFPAELKNWREKQRSMVYGQLSGFVDKISRRMLSLDERPRGPGLAGFYSPAIQAAQNVKLEKGPGSQFYTMIAKTPGVKKDELDWMGLEEWLKARPSLTKASVIDYMEAHQVVMDEKVYGQKAASEPQPKPVKIEDFAGLLENNVDGDVQAFARAVWRIDYGTNIEDTYYVVEGDDPDGGGNVGTIFDIFVPYSDHGGWTHWTTTSSFDIAQHRIAGDRATNTESEETRFETWKVRGGVAYREFLLRMPSLGDKTKSAAREQEIAALRQAIDDLYAPYDALNPDGGWNLNYPDSVDQAAAPIRAQMRELTRRNKPYVSKHFQDSELVHIRADDRVGDIPGGKKNAKILFVNEVQADGHQFGRRYGYDLSDAQINLIIEDAKHEYKEITAKLNAAEGLSLSDPGALSEDATRTLQIRQQELTDFTTYLMETGGVPNMPLKGDLYWELGMKRMLQHAVEQGYDAISWATAPQIAGAVGADPASLTTQYDKKMPSFMAKFTGKWGGKVIPPTLDPATLADSIDAEIAAIIGDRDPATFDHPDHATMMRYYDLLDRRYEVAKVPAFTEEGSTNHILEITPEMRAGLAEPQPLFSYNGERQNPQPMGMTDPYANTVSISLGAIEDEARRTGRSMASITRAVARHEAMEFFLAHHIISPDEWVVLQRAAVAGGWIDTTGVRASYTKMFGDKMGPNQLNELILKEAIMETYGRYRSGEYKPVGKIAAIMKKIADFLDRMKNKLKGQGFEKWEDVFRKVDAGEMKARYEAIYGKRNDQNTIKSQPMVRAGQIPDARALQPGINAQAATVQRPGAIARAREIVTGHAASPRVAGELRGITDLLTELGAAMNLSMRTGRLDRALRQQARAAGQELMGMYNGVARSDIARDIDTLTHEGGHHLERTIPNLRAAAVANSRELVPLAPTLGDPISEGFAEFFRRYITNEPAARRLAPNFLHDFEALLAAHDRPMLDSLHEVQEAYEEFIVGDDVEQGLANQTVLRREPTGVLAPFKRAMQDAERDGFADTFSDRMSWLYQNVVASTHGFWLATRDLLELVEERTGQRLTLAAEDNPTKLLRMTSHTNGWALESLKEGIPLRARANGGGVSMHQVLATAFGNTARFSWNDRAVQEFGEYLIARNAIQEWIRFRPALRQVVQAFIAGSPRLNFLLHRLPQNTDSERPEVPTSASLNHHLRKLETMEQRFPRFRQAAELYYQFNRDMVTFMHEKGLISSEQLTEYLKEKDYAPQMRNMSDREEPAGGGRASRREQKSDHSKLNKLGVFRQRRGSYRDIINPVQSTVQQIYEMHLKAAINDTLSALDRLARAAGPAGNAIFERLPESEARIIQANVREVLRQAARDVGLTPNDTTLMLTNVENMIGTNIVTTMFTQQQTSERGEKIVWFYENGKPIPAQLPDGSLGRMMFEALTSNGARNGGLLLGLIGAAATSVRIGVTTAFEFIFRNVFVDSIAAAINSPYASVIPLKTAIGGAAEIWRGGQYHHLYNRYAGMMGGSASAALNDQSIERDVKLLRERGFSVRRPRSLPELAGMLFKFGEFSETATRVGIFRNAMRSFVADGMAEQTAAIEAASYAHDVMDFSRHGSKTERTRRMIPFFQASINGIDKYTRTLTAANDFGRLISIWQRYQSGQPLSTGETRALGQAAKAWALSTVALGGMSMFCWWLAQDDEDKDEIPDNIRYSHWVISINDVVYLLPKSLQTFIGYDGPTDEKLRFPKPFEMAWFANGVERALDAAVNGDQKAAAGYAKDFWNSVVPPDSIPGLDIAYGFWSGRDFYTGNDVIPFWEKDRARKDQFGPYTTETAKQIGKTFNIAPYYIDYLARGLFASQGRDAMGFPDLLMGKGPQPPISQFPIARRFTTNTGRSSKSVSGFYAAMRDSEGFSSWFWDSVTGDARSFMAGAGSYGERVKSGNEAEARRYLETLNPNQQVFAVLSKDFTGLGRAQYRNLHPMLNAQEGVSVTNSLMKEVVGGKIKLGKNGEDGEQALTRTEMRDLRNEISHVRKGMAQNGMKILGLAGWDHQPMADVDKRLAVVKAIQPKVYDEMIRRLQEEKFVDAKEVAKTWPTVKDRVIAQRGEADLSDLYPGVIDLAN